MFFELARVHDLASQPAFWTRRHPSDCDMQDSRRGLRLVSRSLNVLSLWQPLDCLLVPEITNERCLIDYGQALLRRSGLGEHSVHIIKVRMIRARRPWGDAPRRYRRVDDYAALDDGSVAQVRLLVFSTCCVQTLIRILSDPRTDLALS